MLSAQRRVIGFAYDGQQNCTNATEIPSLFTKFSYNWNGSSADGRLRDWLDPGNTVLGMNGYDPVGTPPPVPGCRVSLRAMLEGAYQSGAMRTDLRTNLALPQQEPYAALGYAHVGDGGGEVMTPAAWTATGAGAIVDWVVVELRSAAQPQEVLATRSALLRSDGMVVDMDGNSPVHFATAPWGNYYIGLRHRNHLGVMTSRPHVLGNVVQTKNLMNGSTEVWQPDDAMKNIGGIRCLWAGDVNGDGRLTYTGPNNDRDPILTRIGGTVPTAVALGYHPDDTDLNARVSYTGAINDREVVLQNIGGNTPTSVRLHRLPE